MERLPLILDNYKDKLKIDLEKGTIVGRRYYLNHKGYKTFNLWLDGKGYYYRAHEIIAYLGNLDLLDKTVDHINGNKTDNRLSNLRTMTALENHQVAKEQGLFPIGEKNHATKLTDQDRVEIISKYKGVWGEQTRLAQEYNVTPSTISRLIKEAI